MPRFLMIGGSHDGTWIETELVDTIPMPVTFTERVMPFLPENDPIPATEMRLELYHAMYWICGSYSEKNRRVVYALEGLSPLRVFDLLLNGYKERG